MPLHDPSTWTWRWHLYSSGFGESKAAESSNIQDKVCQGFSDSSHSKLFFGSAAQRWTLSIIDSEYFSLSSSGSLSCPMQLARWILSHLSPDLPIGFAFENSSMPLLRSYPIWFRWGGIGYTLPLKSILWGKNNSSQFLKLRAMLSLSKNSHLKEWSSWFF